MNEQLYSMSFSELCTLSPLWILALGVLLQLISISFGRNHLLSLSIAIFSLLSSFIASFTISHTSIAGLLLFDDYAMFWLRFLLLASFFICYLFYDTLKKNPEEKPDEIYVLLLLSIIGALVMVLSKHFTSFFLGLELLTLPLYAMLAYLRSYGKAVEAGLKYLILAGSSSAFILFGIVFLYAWAGSLDFEQISSLKNPLILENRSYFYIGAIFLMAGLAFKLSLVPFHMWAPDVYEGALSPVAAHLSLISKGASLAFFLRFFWQIVDVGATDIYWIIEGLAILSMLIGSVLAIYQSDLKRLFAYSSIANMGYVCLCFLLSREQALATAKLYMLAYGSTSLLFFAILSMIENQGQKNPSVKNLSALSQKHPWLARSFAISLFSLIGMPLTSGLIGKWAILKALIETKLFLLVAIVLLSSAISLYAYLRVIIAMYSPEQSSEEKPSAASFSFAPMIAALIAMAVLGLGMWPEFGI